MKRVEYDAEGIDPDRLADDPIEQFRVWFADAADEPQPDTMILATVDGAGFPQARAVLLRGIDTGFVFYTNYHSAKAKAIDDHPHVAACFVWQGLHRQVRIQGDAAPVEDELSDEYWATRPRGAQLAASISPQSETVASREELEAAYEKLDATVGDDVPRPPHWGGYRITPRTIEFWQGRRHRLHDRVRYTRRDGGWRRERLAP